jgi:hypothetical protein
LPTSSFDTFFACTILVAVMLIATTFTAGVLQTQINGTQNINKDYYIKGIADNLVSSPGYPDNWGMQTGLPQQFGLAKTDAADAYELDIDKVNRLNSQNIYTLSYFDVVTRSKINNVALGIKLNQVMDITLHKINTVTIGGNISFSLSANTAINSKPTLSNLHLYAIGNGYLTEVNTNTNDEGFAEVTIQVPITQLASSLLVAFAQAPFDHRVTSYAIYNFSSETQEPTPTEDSLRLSPLNNILHLNATVAADYQTLNCYVFTYSQQRSLNIVDYQCALPRFLDNSPSVIVSCGIKASVQSVEWTAYPQVPLSCGSNFSGTDRNISSYLVTVEGVIYRLEISLGDINY